jgi:branched chain amino acid efflux pump
LSDVWVVVACVGLATVALKAVGPVGLGGRRLPDRLGAVVDLLAPAVLAALVVTQLVGGDREIVLDERLIGIAAASVALLRGAPILVVIVVAAVATALTRAL